MINLHSKKSNRFLLFLPFIKGIKVQKKKYFVRSGIRTHAHIRGPECSLQCSEESFSWVWRLRPLGHPDILVLLLKSSNVTKEAITNIYFIIYLKLLPRHQFEREAETIFGTWWNMLRPLVRYQAEFFRSMRKCTNNKLAKMLKNICSINGLIFQNLLELKPNWSTSKHICGLRIKVLSCMCIMFLCKCIFVISKSQLCHRGEWSCLHQKDDVLPLFDGLYCYRFVST